MISVPTTLILGAGASCPYGYPSGAMLRSLICDQFQDAGGSIFAVVRDLGFTTRDIQSFREAFYRSQVTSIDRFLAINRPFWEVGKAAIAATLIQYEVEDPLLRERVNQPRDRADHWYRYLWNCMDQSWEGFLSNQIQIITFNYDRSLEMFLTIALSNYNGRPFEEALNRVYQLPIIHVYGTLGLIGPDFVAPTRPYSNELRGGAVRIAAQSIRVIPEHRDNEEEQEKIRSMIASVQRICYLGFGYDAINVRRLCLDDVLPNDPHRGGISDAAGKFTHGKDVLGTAYGFRSQEVVAAVRSVKGRMERFRPDLQCEEFLREFGVLL